MAGFYLAADDVQSWPDALVTLGFLAFLAFAFWLALR